jgi:ribose transport system substrate-binding protein
MPLLSVTLGARTMVRPSRARKLPSLLTAVLLIAACLGGCGGGTGGGGGATSRSGAASGGTETASGGAGTASGGAGTGSGQGAAASRVIGVTLQNLTNPFFLVIAENLEKEVARHGYTIDLRSGEDDVLKQQSQLRELKTQKVAAIVLNAKDSRAIGPAIVEVNQAGIPVFTVDIRVLDPDARVVAHVGTDNYGGGRLAAEAMIEALGEAGGKVAVLDYDDVESCIERKRGFRDAVRDHNGSGRPGRVEIVAELPGRGNREKGFESAGNVLQSHPELSGIFAINDPSALGAYAAIEKAGRAGQVVLIGFDGQPEGKKAIKEGKIYADPIQYPDRMGVETARRIIQYLNGEEVERVLDIATSLYRKADAERDPELR